MIGKLFVIFIIVQSATSSQKKQFVPTHEWQIVEPGQHLPPGLHIRHDFQKKITEAKLLDKTETPADNAVVEVKQSETEPDKERISREQLRKALEKMNDEKEKEKLSTTSPEDINRVKKKFRSYDQLKNEVGALNMSIKTDVQLISETVERFESLTKQIDFDNDDEYESLLVDLEYLLHQIDNALEFIRINGLTKVVLPALQFENHPLRLEALRVLQAATQNNPKVQIAAYEADVVPTLIQLLKNANENDIKLSVLSVLSSLLQRFPTAQWKFIESKGLQQIQQLTNDTLNEKFISRILNLILDLFKDSQELAIENSKKHSDASRVANYLASRFQEDGFCGLVEKLITTSGFSEADVSERAITLVQYVNDLCPDLRLSKNFTMALRRLNEMYVKLAEAEIKENEQLSEVADDVDFYFLNLYRQIHNVTRTLYGAKSDVLRKEL